MRRRFVFDAVIIYVVGCLVMTAFRFDDLWVVDDMGYLNDVFNGNSSSLGLGRTGYVYPYHGLWQVFRRLVSSDFRQFIPVIHATNVLIFGVFLISMYALLLRLTNRRFLSAATVTLLATSPATFDSVSRIGSDVLMYALIGISYWSFVKAIEQRSKRLMIFSVCAFGYSIAVREPAISFLGFFPLYLFAIQSRIFSRKFYAFCAALSLAIATAGPLILFLNYQNDYMSSILVNLKGLKNDVASSFLERFMLMVRSHLLKPQLMVIGLVAGAWLALISPNRVGLTYKRFGFLWLVILIPIVAAVAVHVKWAMIEGRFALPLVLGGSFLFAILLERLRFLRALPVVGLITLVLIQLTVRWGSLIELRTEASASEAYYHRILPYLNGDTVLIAGMELYSVSFRRRLDNKDVNFIDPGWGWPGNLLESDVAAYLDAGNRVIYDPLSTWYSAGPEDLKPLRKKFIFEPLGSGFIQIKKRSD